MADILQILVKVRLECSHWSQIPLSDHVTSILSPIGRSAVTDWHTISGTALVLMCSVKPCSGEDNMLLLLYADPAF